MTKDRPKVHPKHVPSRTCVSCRKTTAKRELIRLVRLEEGSIDIDATGKKSGRGAYLCPSRDCWESALNAGRLEYALHTRLKPDDKERLVNYARGLDNNTS
jgi:predicted RNA-binding protein YlxR (DUF448 family)